MKIFMLRIWKNTYLHTTRQVKSKVEYGHPNECNEVPIKNLKRKKIRLPSKL